MTIEASMAPHSQVEQITHPELCLLLSRARLPFFNRMRTQPTRRRTVAILTTHPIADVETLGAHFGCNGKCMASEAFLVLIWRCLQIQNFSNAEGNVI